MLVPACCRIWSFEKLTISLAMSTSRIRLSDATRFSWYVARLLRRCSRRVLVAPGVAPGGVTLLLAGVGVPHRAPVGEAPEGGAAVSAGGASVLRPGAPGKT